MGFLAQYEQHKGSNLPVSHDFGPFATQHSTTLTDAAAQNATSGLTITDEAASSGLWSARLAATVVGNYTYELKGTFADGSEQVLEFLLCVVDPAAPTASTSTVDYVGQIVRYR